MRYFVYILQSQNGRYYIGSTVNLRKRLTQHQNGSTPSTRRMGDLELAFSQSFPSLKIARSIESRLKKLKRRDYMERIIKDGEIKIQ